MQSPKHPRHFIRVFLGYNYWSCFHARKEKNFEFVDSLIFRSFHVYAPSHKYYEASKLSNRIKSVRLSGIAQKGLELPTCIYDDIERIRVKTEFLIKRIVGSLSGYLTESETGSKCLSATWTIFDESFFE